MLHVHASLSRAHWLNLFYFAFRNIALFYSECAHMCLGMFDVTYRCGDDVRVHDVTRTSSVQLRVRTQLAYPGEIHITTYCIQCVTTMAGLVTLYKYALSSW